MTVLRRLFLLLLTAIVPLAITALLHAATLFLLSATDRMIAPDVLRYATIAEFVALLFLMVLELKSRW